MQRGRVKLQQSKMSLLIIRISALALLVGFISAHFTCRQDVQSGLMRDLWKHTRVLISRLPKENHFSRRFRLLPNFCVRCQERAIGWLEVRELIDIYQRSVFSSEVIQELLHPHYNDLMYGLQHTLQHCVSSSEPSKYSKILKKLEKRIKKTRKDEGDKGDEGVLKAIREFTYILRWINELTHHPAL